MKTKTLSAGKLSVLFMITYMVSYLTRTNYGGVIVEMVSATGFSKAALSVALTGSFITYGIGQIVVGFLGDRIQPKKLVTLGLVVTVCMNTLVPLCTAPWQMSVLWSMNGFAQAFMWPPLIKLMTGLLSEKEYDRGIILVSYGGSAGTVLIFLLAPVIIAIGSWKWVFWGAASCGILMILAWNLWCPKLPLSIPAVQKGQKASGSFRMTPMFLVILIAIILQGALRDGVTTWTPSYISEIYHLGNGTAILSSVILPIFGMLCHTGTGWLYGRFIKNPILCGGVMFAMGTAAAVSLYFMTGVFAVPSILCIALLAGCMHGVNLMLVCMLPRFYQDTGRVSFISGLLNSCTYVGSAVSTYGIAVLTEKTGWSSTILVWALIALCGTVLCLCAVPTWKRKSRI